MARKNNDSLLEDLLNLSTKLTWKVNLALSLASYMGFHYAASLPTPTAKNMSSLSDIVLTQALISFSAIFQYLVPTIFLIGTAVSAIKAKKRAKVLEQQSSIETIRALSWQEFELLVGEAFKRKGFEVREKGGGGADGGIDLILRKNGRKSIVQCKRWKNASVSVMVVRELYGVMTAEYASDCILVSSGAFTSEARLFAENKPIWLIDGPELLKLVADVQHKVLQTKSQSEGTNPSLENPCPLCGSIMVRRIAKRGINAGNEFWGCSKFPSCRGTQ